VPALSRRRRNDNAGRNLGRYFKKTEKADVTLRPKELLR
jgi:hypothetical protein